MITRNENLANYAHEQFISMKETLTKLEKSFSLLLEPNYQQSFLDFVNLPTISIDDLELKQEEFATLKQALLSAKINAEKQLQQKLKVILKLILKDTIMMLLFAYLTTCRQQADF